MKRKTKHGLATPTFLVQETLPQAEAEGHDQQGCHRSDWNQDGEGRSNYAGQQEHIQIMQEADWS